MIKNIHTLIKDIDDVCGSNEGWFTGAVAEGFVRQLGTSLVENAGRTDEVPRLRLSQMGDRCPCALWHSIHSPSLQEPLPAQVKRKLTYGHVIESLGIAWAKAAGHEVTGEQEAVYVDGIRGTRDCVIDGCVVDVKSTNSLSFQKIKKGLVAEDHFLSVYLAQLDGYIMGSAEDPLVRVKDRGYLLAIDKVLGHICLYEHRVRPEFIRERIRSYKEIVSLEVSPRCTCGIEEDGTSGNLKLDIPASYNSFKHACADNRGEKIRTFLYEGGPRFLTKVVRRPMRRDNKTPIPEVDINGRIVYN